MFLNYERYYLNKNKYINIIGQYLFHRIWYTTGFHFFVLFTQLQTINVKQKNKKISTI